MLEHNDKAGAASVTLTWTGGGVAQECPIDARGWLGEHFTNVDLEGKAERCRDDDSIGFEWGDGPPVEGLPADKFSVRWTRTADFEEGRYTFTLIADDGGRLYLDGELVVDGWAERGRLGKPSRVTTDLRAGAHTLVVEYYDADGDAAVSLVTTGPR